MKQRAKERRAQRKLREAERKAKRRAKREAKAAPKRSLQAWSREVRELGRCAVCPATAHLNAHHLLPKERYPEFRYELENGICLCPTCHKFGKYSFHRNPIWAILWLKRNRPEQYAWCRARVGEEHL